MYYLPILGQLDFVAPLIPSALFSLGAFRSQEALVLLGVLYAKHKQRLPALSKFKRALELNPHLSDAWIAQAQVREKQVDPFLLRLARATQTLLDLQIVQV